MNELVISGVIREDAPKKVEGVPVFGPLCIWCGAEWSEDNVKLEIEGASYCETCGSDGYPALQIVCHECGKLMYEKSGSW